MDILKVVIVNTCMVLGIERLEVGEVVSDKEKDVKQVKRIW